MGIKMIRNVFVFSLGFYCVAMLNLFFFIIIYFNIKCIIHNIIRYNYLSKRFMIQFIVEY